MEPVSLPILGSAPTQPVKKRGPGRPPKKTNTPNVECVGVTTTPYDSKNDFELCHYKPGMWKNLVGFFQSIHAGGVIMRCSPQALTLYTDDHSGNMKVLACHNVHKMEYYYCEAEFLIQVKQSDIEGIFKSINDSFGRIVIQRLRANPTQIKIILTDFTLQKENTFSVQVSTPGSLDDIEALDEYYRSRETNEIHFTLQNRQLKNSMEMASKHSTIGRYDCFGQGPLQLHYATNNCLVSCVETYRDNRTINLVSSLAENQCTQVQFRIPLVKSFTDANKFDTVNIYGSSGGRPLLFVTGEANLQLCNVITTDTI